LNFKVLSNHFKQKAMNKATKLLLALVLFCSACSSSSDQASKDQPEIPFDKTKWNENKDGQYTYRKQMITDLLTNHKWEGMQKDSVIQILGAPYSREEGLLMYDYEKTPFLGGLGTRMEALVFELNADSTIKTARLNDGGWD
jgi:hypothetical protein